MSSEIIRRARQTDLVAWLRNNGEQVISVGNEWSIKGYDSLRIRDNRWYRHSHGKGGNPVDFIVDFYKLSFIKAVEMLTGEKICGTQEKNFSGVATACDLRRVQSYLIDVRHIPAKIVSEVLQKHTILQEAKTNNAVFLMTDECNNFVGAEVVGTLAKYRFKGVKSGSVCRYGYSFGQKENPKYTLFFESAIDLLSFVAISQAEKKSLTGCLLVSMAGLRLGVVENFLSIWRDTTPVLCVDNDTAGSNFISQIRSAYPNTIVKQPATHFNDWNDQLCGSRSAITT